MLIESMYVDNTRVFEVAGSPVVENKVKSGIRQGCPMSGALLVLALDPLIRWLMWQRMLNTARLFAFADDLAAVLAAMRSTLPEVLGTLRWRRRVSTASD